MANPVDPKEQQARQNLLDALYVQTGRDRPDHPMHGLYSGLWQEMTKPTAEPDAS